MHDLIQSFTVFTTTTQHSPLHVLCWFTVNFQDVGCFRDTAAGFKITHISTFILTLKQPWVDLESSVINQSTDFARFCEISSFVVVGNTLFILKVYIQYDLFIAGTEPVNGSHKFNYARCDTTLQSVKYRFQCYNNTTNWMSYVFLAFVDRWPLYRCAIWGRVLSPRGAVGKIHDL